jgi:hypothetical protein
MTSLICAASALAFAPYDLSAKPTEVVVENRSKGPIFVALAYKKLKGEVATEGWVRIENNGSKTFKAPAENRMHLRIVRNGKEVTWKKYESLLWWPVHSDQYSVSRTSSAPSIRVFRWGSKPEKSRKLGNGDPLPQGWESQRFFELGAGPHHLRVTPE